MSSIFDPADNSTNRAVPWDLGSLLQLAPTVISPALPTSNLEADRKNDERGDKGKGKARAVDSDDIDQSGPEPAPMEDEVLGDMIRQGMAVSRGMGFRVRSPDEAGPLGSVTPALTGYHTSL